MRPTLSTSAFRQAARPRRFNASTQTRFASTTSENAQKKAQDALGAAQKNMEKLWEITKNSLGPLGERAGSMLGCTCLSFSAWRSLNADDVFMPLHLFCFRNVQHTANP